jgi:anti-sigma B factor antagonist
MDERPGAGRANGFAVATQQLNGGAPVVSVMGEVDSATAPGLERKLVAVAEEQTGEVIVDLRGCRFFDSIGLRVLLATKGRLEQSNRRLALVVSNTDVMRIFQLTRFDELFEIYPSLRAAVQRNANGNSTVEAN